LTIPIAAAAPPIKMFRVLAAPSAKAGAIELSVTAAASALAVKNFAFNSSLLCGPPTV
jgi:hypothetical protein